MKWNWHFAGYGLAALIVLGLLVAYHRSEVANARADAGQQAREEANKQSQAQIKDLQARIDQDKAETKAQVAALVQTVASLKTPQQQVQWSQEQLKDVIKGVLFEVNPKTGEVTATIPKESVPDIPAAIEKCKTCELNLDSATKQLTYSQQQQQLLSSQLLNVGKERDDWKSAAKGGSWIKRFGKAAKYLVIGGAIGYVAARH